MSVAGGHGGGPHRAKLAHVQRQTGGDGDGGDGAVALTLVAHKKSKASPYNFKLEGDGDGGDGGVQLCGGGWPHHGGQAEAVEQPRAYDK